MCEKNSSPPCQDPLGSCALWAVICQIYFFSMWKQVIYFSFTVYIQIYIFAVIYNLASCILASITVNTGVKQARTVRHINCMFFFSFFYSFLSFSFLLFSFLDSQCASENSRWCVSVCVSGSMRLSMFDVCMSASPLSFNFRLCLQPGSIRVLCSPRLFLPPCLGWLLSTVIEMVLMFLRFKVNRRMTLLKMLTMVTIPESFSYQQPLFGCPDTRQSFLCDVCKTLSGRWECHFHFLFHNLTIMKPFGTVSMIMVYTHKADLTCCGSKSMLFYFFWSALALTMGCAWTWIMYFFFSFITYLLLCYVRLGLSRFGYFSRWVTHAGM